ncbi:MAG: hypothetical protein ACYDCG_12400 [Candidatus Acidiferrales bacterium]
MRARADLLRVPQRVCLLGALRRSGKAGDLKVAATTAARAANFSVAAYRPAGTREALPGAMCRTCALRFDRRGTINRAPTTKIWARADCDGAR